MDSSSGYPLYPIYRDSLTVNKNTYTLNALFRRTAVFGSFFINVHLGVGLRYKQTAQIGRLDPQDYFEGDHPTAWKYADRTSPKFTAAFPLGLSVGYRFF